MKKRLQIAIFDGSFKTTPFIKRLVNGLLEHHDVAIFGFAENEPTPIKNVQYIALGSAEKPLRLLMLSAKFSFKALFKLGSFKLFFKWVKLLVSRQKQQLQQYNFNIAVRLFTPDIFHVQWPSLLPWCETLLNDSKMKVVLSQRGYQNNVRPFIDNSNFKFLQSLYPKIDGFHSVSQAMITKSDVIYASPNKIDDVVYTGFDFELLPFQETYVKANPLKIISIGRPHWKKGFNYAIKAMEILKQRGIMFTYQIVGGSGNEELLYHVTNCNLSNEISLLGRISQQEVYEKMTAASIFLLPSLEEGLPNVMVEAMALGVPVIAANCGGICELLDESTGIIIPTRDAKHMADAITSFAEISLDVINERRLNARKRVEVQHSEQQMVQGMEALYYKCLESSS